MTTTTTTVFHNNYLLFSVVTHHYYLAVVHLFPFLFFPFSSLLIATRAPGQLFLYINFIIALAWLYLRSIRVQLVEQCKWLRKMIKRRQTWSNHGKSEFSHRQDQWRFEVLAASLGLTNLHVAVQNLARPRRARFERLLWNGNPDHRHLRRCLSGRQTQSWSS